MKSRSFYHDKLRRNLIRYNQNGGRFMRKDYGRVIQLLEPDDETSDDKIVDELLRKGVTPKVVAVLVPNRVLPLSVRAATITKPSVCLGSELWKIS